MRLLRYFVTVAEERHFGRAAERLHIAQPPLSQQIQKLERQLGVELIDRSRRPIELTDAGNALLGEAKLALTHGERAFAAAAGAATGISATFISDALQAAVDGVLSYVMRAHRRDFPDVKLELTELDTAEQVTQLVEHRLDVGFLRGPVDDPSLTIQTLIEDPLAAVVCDDHALAAQERIASTALADQPIVLWTRTAAPTTYADVIELFRKHHIEPPVVDEIPAHTNDSRARGIRSGNCVAAHVVHQSQPQGVRFIPLSGPLPHRPLAAAWRSSNQSPSVRCFLDVARQTSPQYLRDLSQHYPQLASPSHDRATR